MGSLRSRAGNPPLSEFLRRAWHAGATGSRHRASCCQSISARSRRTIVAIPYTERCCAPTGRIARRRRIRAPRITAVGDESTVHKDELHGRRPVANLNAPSAESVSRSVCGLPRTTTVLSRCDWGADEKWRRQSSEYDPVNAGRASRESNEMRPLRYSINLTLDGCCHHEAGLPRTRSRCATGPLRWNEPMPCYSAG